jgi:hypothetical protein
MSRLINGLPRSKKLNFMRQGCLLFLLVLVVGFLGCERLSTQNPQFEFKTDNQLVILDNGSAYFGKLENQDKPFILLKDVYYIQTQVNPETKATTNTLIKRGKELHGPEFMYVNRQHITMIEPVAPDSQLAKLIAEEKAKSAGTK